MPLFLNARHWQIFTLQMIPIVCIFLLGDMFSPWQLGFMWVLLVCISIAWLYSIGTAANQQLDASLQKNQLVFAATSLACVLLFITVLLLMFRASQTQTPPPSWLVHVLFVGLANFFYTLWFAACQLVSAEKKAQAFYIEYAFPMLGFWFGFVGAWFLQPRVNRLLGRQASD